MLISFAQNELHIASKPSPSKRHHSVQSTFA